MSSNTDDLIAQMQADELADATKLTPREYGKLKGIAPQLVYYYIRAGHIKVESCLCGRKVIDVAQADAYLAEKAKKDKSAVQATDG